VSAPATSSAERQIRVFISSTFRDMKAERELLVKQVFPELRAVCAARFVTFTEVDLRWGITEEQQADGQVLSICLEEIQRCRPYFISLLGERYGWIPDNVPAEVVAREPWLKEHVGGRTSVTELEILHGVLNDPAMADHAFFYFRDPTCMDPLPEEERWELVERDIPDEVAHLGAAEAARRTAERREKLTALKERIRGTGLPVSSYATPAALAEAVRRQLYELIEQLYPKELVPDALIREAAGHAAHARGKLLAYVARPAHTVVLDEFVAGESSGKGLVVTGASGRGKTALLADWMDCRRRAQPAAFGFEHYLGATPESATVSGLLVRLLGELKRRYAIAEEIPADPVKMRDVLPLWLAQATGRERIVLVLDGLNQIEGDEADRRLAWLPHYFPPQVRVLASALPGLALEALRERGWLEHEVPPADATERDEMIATFLEHYRKTLRADLRQQIAAAPGSANPLFLRTMLEELRQFGSFEGLPAEVARYLEARDPQELLRLVIRRWRQDFDGGRDLVRHALRHLWAARQGLAESEWLELLSVDTPLPRQQWFPLFFALEPHLAQRGGLFAFGHDFLRQAVRVELMGDEADVRAAHLALADCFEGHAVSLRTATELPWQLREAGERPRLRTSMLNVDRFLLIRERDKNECLSYWIWLGDERRMGPAYVERFRVWSEAAEGSNARVVWAGSRLASFLAYASLHADAEPLMRWVLQALESNFGADHTNVQAALSNLATLLHDTDRLAEAEPLMRRALAIQERNCEADHPDTANALRSLAALLKDANKLAEAESMSRRALGIWERSLGPDHPRIAAALTTLGLLLQATNRLAEAEPLLRRALAIDELTYGPDHPEVGTDLHNLSQLLQDMNRLTEAEPLMRRALGILEKGLGPDHVRVATALGNLAYLLRTRNQLVEAELLMRRALTIEERNCGTDRLGVARALAHLAQLLQSTNRMAEAEPLMRRALAICERDFPPDHPNIAVALGTLANLLQTTNRLAEAEPLMRRVLAIGERSDGTDHPNVAIALNNLALLLQATGRLEEAEPLMRRALQIFERSFGSKYPMVAGVLGNLARLLQAMGRTAEAEQLMWRSLTVAERSCGPDHPNVAIALNNLALLLEGTGRPAEAEPLMRRALEVFFGCSRTTGHRHPHLQGAINGYAAILRQMGRSEEETLARLDEIGRPFRFRFGERS
jgi:tetratricopeptide (TPR) repeat protein